MECLGLEFIALIYAGGLPYNAFYWNDFLRSYRIFFKRIVYAVCLLIIYVSNNIFSKVSFLYTFAISNWINWSKCYIVINLVYCSKSFKSEKCCCFIFFNWYAQCIVNGYNFIFICTKGKIISGSKDMLFI